MSDKPTANQEEVVYGAHQTAAPRRSERRRSPSLFGPIVLIAVGAVILLANLGYLPSTLHWEAALSLWPLMLIFLGLNLIVRQAPRPFGSFLSALVGVVAIGVFGYVLLFADQLPILNADSARNAATVQRDVPISHARDGIDSAEVRIDFNDAAAAVVALENDANLIEGSVTYTGDLIFDVAQDGDSAEIVLDSTSGGWWWLNPGNWNNFAASDGWQVGLNPEVAYELDFDAGSGAYDYDLAAFTLNDFIFDGGSGAGRMALPGGNYAARLDLGSGATHIVLPRNGDLSYRIDSGSGGLQILLPDSMEARIEIDSGSGSFNPGDRLARVADSVWETPNFADATDRIDIQIDGGSGAITIDTAAQGR
jgi:hypothetical protein